MNTFEIGTIVKGFYKTGAYIGEVTDVRPNHYLVKIKAVLTHPAQGDLHHPKQADVPFFHERRALAFGEQTNIPHQMVKPCFLTSGVCPAERSAYSGRLRMGGTFARQLGRVRA